jgi:hypothetical protein
LRISFAMKKSVPPANRWCLGLVLISGTSGFWEDIGVTVFEFRATEIPTCFRTQDIRVSYIIGAASL